MTAELRIIAAVADLREVPDPTAVRGKLESELLYGETFIAEKEQNDWIYGTCTHDGYKGWVYGYYMTDIIEAPTHLVSATRSFLFRDPSIKSPVLSALSFSSKVTVAEIPDKGKFARLSDGRWIFKHHLDPFPSVQPDYASTAMQFLETPYSWGGRSSFGIDCSGLVQVCLGRAGIMVPRDTGDQINAEALNRTPVAATDPLKRGDIVYFKNHVGIMTSPTHIIHADGDGDGDGAGYEMRVRIETIEGITARRGAITFVKRP